MALGIPFRDVFAVMACATISTLIGMGVTHKAYVLAVNRNKHEKQRTEGSDKTN